MCLHTSLQTEVLASKHHKCHHSIFLIESPPAPATQGTDWQDLPFLSTMCILGIELRSSDLGANKPLYLLTHLLIPSCSFNCQKSPAHLHFRDISGVSGSGMGTPCFPAAPGTLLHSVYLQLPIIFFIDPQWSIVNAQSARCNCRNFYDSAHLWNLSLCAGCVLCFSFWLC